MRTHILIAAALLVATTAAQAAPRSLSTSQTNPVESAPVTGPILKVQSAEPAQNEAPKAAEQPAAAPSDPVRAAPVAPSEAKPVEAKPVEAKQVETKPAPEARPAKHAQRRHKQRHATVEQRVQREFRTLERNIGAGLGAALAVIPSFYYW